MVSAYPGTSSSWSLSWKAPDGLLLNYTLRTEAGEGPLALLALRNFTLPETIFSVRASAERVPLTDDIPGEEDTEPSPSLIGVDLQRQASFAHGRPTAN